MRLVLALSLLLVSCSPRTIQTVCKEVTVRREVRPVVVVQKKTVVGQKHVVTTSVRECSEKGVDK